MKRLSDLNHRANLHVYTNNLETLLWAGQVIAEFENSGERASVLQAEGAYDAAKAARDLARINQGSATVSLSEN